MKIISIYYKKKIVLICLLIFFIFSNSGFLDAKDKLGKDVRVWVTSCTGCHGTDGYSKSSLPSLNTLSEELIEDLMIKYKNDEIDGLIMNQIAKGYTDNEIKKIAEYFGSLER